MFRDSFIILGMRIAGTIVWFIYTIILAKSLSKFDFSTVVYIINFSLVATLVIGFGFESIIVRTVPKLWFEGKTSSISSLLSRARLSITIASVALFAFLCAFHYAGFKSPVSISLEIALLTSICTLLTTLMGVNRDTLRSCGNIVKSQLGFNFVRSLVPVIGSAVAISCDMSLSSSDAILLFILSLLISMILEEIFLVKIGVHGFNLRSIKNLIDFRGINFSHWVGDISNAVLLRSMGLVATINLDPELAAIILMAERISNLSQFPIAAASQAAAPHISKELSAGGKETQNLIGKGSLFVAAGGLIGWVGTLVAAEPALWIVGDDFESAFLYVLVLSIYNAGYILFGMSGSTLVLAGAGKTYTIISTTITILCCSFLYFLPNSYSPFILALGWSFFTITAQFLYFISVLKVSNFSTGSLAAFKYARSRGFILAKNKTR